MALAGLRPSGRCLAHPAVPRALLCRHRRRLRRRRSDLPELRFRPGIRSTGTSHPSSTRSADSCRGDEYWEIFLRTTEYVAIALAICLLIGYPVAYYISRHSAAHEIDAAGAADPALLGQLSHAHAGLGQSVLARRATSTASCVWTHIATDAAGLAERQSRLGHSGPGLRLYPLSHPAAAGRPRPHRQEPAGGGARSRRQPLQRPSCM